MKFRDFEKVMSAKRMSTGSIKLRESTKYRMRHHRSPGVPCGFV